MQPLIDTSIEQYAANSSEKPSALLTELYQATHEQCDLPQMLIGSYEAAFLRFLIRAASVRRILEVGTFTGYSALAMAEALPEDGQITTLDICAETTGMARTFWSRSPAGKKITALTGDAREILKTLSSSFDMVFIDADKENYIQYWESSLPLVRKGGVLAADNVLWSGGALNPKSESDRAIAAFNAHVSSDDRVIQVMMTIRDGLTVAWKK